MPVLPPVKMVPPILPRTVFVFETMHLHHAGLVAAAAKNSMHCETNLKCAAVAVVAIVVFAAVAQGCVYAGLPSIACRNRVRTTFVWRALTL